MTCAPWLRKLRRNQPLTATDLQELDALLHEAGDIARARALYASLPMFIRSLVGLDREAAAAADVEQLFAALGRFEQPVLVRA